MKQVQMSLATVKFNATNDHIDLRSTFKVCPRPTKTYIGDNGVNSTNKTYLVKRSRNLSLCPRRESGEIPFKTTGYEWSLRRAEK